MTDFVTAIKENNVGNAKEELKNGSDPNLLIDNDTTALCFVSRKGYYQFAKLLLDNGAHVNHISNNLAPIHEAIDHDHNDIVKLLLENNANPNLKINEYYDDCPTVLHRAVRKSNYEITKLLLSMKRTDLNIYNRNNRTAIDFASSEYIQQLINAEINRRVSIDCQNQAIVTGKTELDKKIIEKEAEVANLRSQLTSAEQNLTSLRRERANLERGENDDINLSLKSNCLECPVCLELPTAPRKVFQCVNGHVYCSLCGEALTNCPICKVALNADQLIRNLLHENLVAAI